MLVELTLEQPVHVGPVVGGQPAAFDEQVRQADLLTCGPQGTHLDELGLIDQVGLKSKDAEEEIAVRGAGLRRRGTGEGRQWPGGAARSKALQPVQAGQAALQALAQLRWVSGS